MIRGGGVTKGGGVTRGGGVKRGGIRNKRDGMQGSDIRESGGELNNGRGQYKRKQQWE